METTYKDILYMVGDKIKMNEYGDEEVIGEIKFGEYNDTEGYYVMQHLGFYVEYDDHRYKGNQKTLPDVINYCHGVLL